MPSYVCLIKFKDQGIRNIQDTGNAARLPLPRLRRWG